MRDRWAFGVLLAISLLVGSRDTRAADQRCLGVVCGAECITHDVNYGGWCNPPAPKETGCVQLFGPDCASMNTYCCQSTEGASVF